MATYQCEKIWLWRQRKGSQWSFSSKDLAFLGLFALRQRPLKNIAFSLVTLLNWSPCRTNLVSDWTKFWQVNSCVKASAVSPSLFTDNWLKPRVLLSFKLFVFFQCCRNMKYSPFQDSFVVQSWFAVVVVEETRSCLPAIGYDYWTDQIPRASSL